MYVCICKAITDHDIRRAAADGAQSVQDLRASLGVASGCGSCVEHAEEILQVVLAPQRSCPQRHVPTSAGSSAVLLTH